MKGGGGEEGAAAAAAAAGGFPLAADPGELAKLNHKSP